MSDDPGLAYLATMVLTNLMGGEEKALSPPSSRGGWLPIIRESYAGAWQQNVEVRAADVMTQPAVFACMTLIASDVAKLRIKLVQLVGRIWVETTNPAYSPVLRKPNANQNRIQFYESWVLSKVSRGNTYVLKGRDERGVVNRLWVLNPDLVTVLVSDSGDVFYELRADNISGLEGAVLVPAREVIHDRYNCLYHPLVGLSPIVANGLTATQGLSIQRNMAQFFANSSKPGGVLSAPGHINDDTAARLKASWDANYSGENYGKTAVLGDGLEYAATAVTPVDAQLVEQLKWTAEVVCSTFHVPPYKIGVGALPSYNNVQALNVEYYQQCLQGYLEAIELCLDEGLGLALEGNQALGVEFDLTGLMRMDALTQMQVLKEGVAGSILAPDEAREAIDKPPVPGGASPMAQQQQYSLAALAKRDAKDDPFATAPKAADASPPPSAASPAANDNAAALAAAVEKRFGRGGRPVG